jgi:hypothetical protein
MVEDGWAGPVCCYSSAFFRLAGFFLAYIYPIFVCSIFFEHKKSVVLHSIVSGVFVVI